MRDPGDVTPSFLTRAMSWAQGGTPRVAPASRAGAAAPGAVTVDVGLATTTKRGGAVSFDDKPPPPSPSLAGGDAGDIEGLDIAFDRLSFTVPGRRGGGGIQILREACGYAAAGRLTAMQGPSGAGKSTLLKVLACAISGGEVRGAIYVNGAPVVAKEFRAASAVVWQRDILMSTATVREAIMTSAQLRLPQGMSAKEKRRRVDHIIAELGLDHRRDMMIGEDLDGTVCSVSGGERRRVSIGVALVTDPRAVFLDEPTTGLDSDGALSTVRLLKRLAGAGRTVLCTIHQPSADICQRYDDFILLAGGQVLYCGPWSGAEAYFNDLGRPRPSYRNLAEHILALAKDQRVVAAASAAHRDAFDLEAVLGADAEAGGPTAAPYERSLSRWSLRHTVTALNMVQALSLDSSEVATSLPHQVGVLCVRFFRHMYRAPLNVAVQLVQYLFFGTLVGLTYWRVPSDASGGTFDRVASLWFVTACLVLQPAQNAVAVFARERALLRRETGGRLYSYAAFFTAKSLTQLPLQLAFVLAFSVLVYSMIGFQASIQKFLIFYGVQVVVALASDTVGQLTSSMHRETVVGQILNGMVCLLLLMFTGFIQTKTPAYFVWLKKSSYVAFAYSAVVRNEFTGLTLAPPTSAPHGAPPVDGMAAVPANVNNGLSIAADFGWLVGIMVAVRVFTYVWINTAIRKHWL